VTIVEVYRDKKDGEFERGNSGVRFTLDFSKSCWENFWTHKLKNAAENKHMVERVIATPQPK